MNIYRSLLRSSLVGVVFCLFFGCEGEYPGVTNVNYPTQVYSITYKEAFVMCKFTTNNTYYDDLENEHFRYGVTLSTQKDGSNGVEYDLQWYSSSEVDDLGFDTYYRDGYGCQVTGLEENTTYYVYPFVEDILGNRIMEEYDVYDDPYSFTTEVYEVKVTTGSCHQVSDTYDSQYEYPYVYEFNISVSIEDNYQVACFGIEWFDEFYILCGYDGTEQVDELYAWRTFWLSSTGTNGSKNYRGWAKSLDGQMFYGDWETAYYNYGRAYVSERTNVGYVSEVGFAE